MGNGDKIENKKLLETIEELKKENTPRNLTNFVDTLVTSRFLIPATLDPKPVRDADGRIVGDGKFKVNFRLITDNRGNNFFACFTCDEEFDKANQNASDVEKMALGYKEVAPIVLRSNGKIQGFVVDPYTAGMQVPEPMIRAIENRRENVIDGRKSNVKKQEIPPNTKIRLRSPKYMPIDMMEEAKKFFAEHETVKAAYLQMMEKGDENEEYLITIDFEGEENVLFDALLPKLKPFAFGIPIALTGVDNGLGKKVVENTEPFYQTGEDSSLYRR